MARLHCGRNQRHRRRIHIHMRELANFIQISEYIVVGRANYQEIRLVHVGGAVNAILRDEANLSRPQSLLNGSFTMIKFV